MAVDLNKVKRDLNKVYRTEDKALAKLQKYFESNNSNVPSKSIQFTTDLNIGGFKLVLGHSTVDINNAGKIIKETNKVNSIRHSHNIEWKDIERAYKIREAIHYYVAEEYAKAGSTYRGRRLFQQGPFIKGSKNKIYGSGSDLTVGGDANYGYGSRKKIVDCQIINVGKYGKLDVDIQRRALEKIYSAIWKETNTHLLEKFNKMQLKGSDFKSVIKGTQELIYDIKKVKDWKETVDDLVKQATIEYEARIKELNRQIVKEQKQRDILTIDQLETIGRAILGLAIEYCPIETGFLRSSGKLYVSNNSIRIIFECPYGVYVHDNPNAQHPVGRYHFLIDAAQEILPKISVWTEQTGNDSFILGNYMKETWDRDESGKLTSDMYWQEQKGYQAVYIDIDTNLRINYYHRN